MKVKSESNKVNLTVRTDAELREMLEKYAEDRGISLSAVVNIALAEKLKKIKECAV